MTRVLDYSYINARLHALCSKLFSDDFYNILQRTASLSEILHLLNKTDYHSLEGIYSQTGDIKLVELSLFQLRYDLYKNLKKHAPSFLKPLIDGFIRRISFDVLKISLRLWFDQSFRMRSITDFAEYIPRTIPLEGISIDEIINAHDLNILIQRLSKTPYQFLIPQLKNIPQSKNLYRTELLLDKEYFRLLCIEIKELSAYDRKLVTAFMAYEIDRKNLNRLLRLTKNNQIEEAGDFFIPGGSRITQDDFSMVLGSPQNMGIITEILEKRFQLHVSSDQLRKEKDFLLFADKKLKEELFKQARKTKNSSSFDAGLAVVYLLLKEDEIANLIKIINAGYYGMNTKGGSL